MEDIRLLKLKASLIDAMTEWVNTNCDGEGWDALDTHVSDCLCELMGDAAFAILMAQSDLTAYYKNNDMLKND